MSCSFALYWIFFLLINRIIKPMRVHVAMTAVIGMALCAFNKPTKAAAKDPNPICIAPMSADALPASLVNGAIDKAAEFGKLKPWQLRNKKIKKYSKQIRKILMMKQLKSSLLSLMKIKI